MKVKEYVKAKSLEEAYSLLKANPLNRVVGGGLWLKKGNMDLNMLIDLSGLGLDKIEEKDGFIEIGALVTLREVEKSELLQEAFHSLVSKAAGLVMGPAFRNIATIGGSVAGKLAFSDVITALLACNASLRFYPSGEKSLEEYLKEPGLSKEILTHIIVKQCHRLSFYKRVGLTELDYPIISVAITHCVKHDKYTVAVGSRAGVAALAEDVMKALEAGERDFEKVAKEVLKMKFNDSLASKAEYRAHLAEVYVRRGLEEVSK
ncbi:MAG: FAD binding domain-containing protein [Bacilli bacterium]|nr:FAD binding domain-containing protein [Bacilli bacterium]